VLKYLIILLLALVSGPLLALAASPAQPGQPVLVIVAPWADPALAVQAAGGQVVSPVAGWLGILAVFEGQGMTAPRAGGGIWLMADGRAMARLCGARL
jgi:hypothetical protein